MEDGFTVNDRRGVDGGDQPEVKEATQETKQSTKQETQKAKPKTFLDICFDEDILGPWVANGSFPNKYKIDRVTGLVVNSDWSYVDHNLPWVMVNNDATRDCEFYKDVDKLYDIIPPPCMNCWKVVVMPKTVKQLFQLLQIEEEMVEADPYCFCKCGIELRQEVERNYGGYFYCNDLNQGLMRLQQVRERVQKVMGDEVPVILKRACTEYERKYGPSDKWDSLVTPRWGAIWNKLLNVFKVTKGFNKQPLLVQKHIIMTWIAHAASIGDPSIPELNGGSKIYPGYVTYEYPKDKETDNG